MAGENQGRKPGANPQTTRKYGKIGHMDEQKRLLGLAEDKCNQCRNKYIPTHTGFLDARQQSLLRQTFRREVAQTQAAEEQDGGFSPDLRLYFTGGYPDADRTIMLCLPDYAQRAEWEEELLCVLRVRHSAKSSASRTGRPLAHGDYLGALTGLGLKRDVIGDILVSPEGADIVILQEVGSFLLTNLAQAGRSTLSPELLPLSELQVPLQELEESRDTVASPRLDSLVAAAFKLSRGKAAQAIQAGLVFVDHLEVTQIDKVIPEGAEVVLRHKGKVKLLAYGKPTRKDRIPVTFGRYK